MFELEQRIISKQKDKQNVRQQQALHLSCFQSLKAFLLTRSPSCAVVGYERKYKDCKKRTSNKGANWTFDQRSRKDWPLSNARIYSGKAPNWDSISSGFSRMTGFTSHCCAKKYLQSITGKCTVQLVTAETRAIKQRCLSNRSEFDYSTLWNNNFLSSLHTRRVILPIGERLANICLDIRAILSESPVWRFASYVPYIIKFAFIPNPANTSASMNELYESIRCTRMLHWACHVQRATVKEQT